MPPTPRLETMCRIVRGPRLESLAEMPVRWAAPSIATGASRAAFMPLSLPRNAQLWLPAVLGSHAQQLFRRRHPDGPTHIFFCIADHFEPSHGTTDRDVERARVAAWVDGYPRLAGRFADADGRPPQHTFFFPEEDYRPELLDALAGLC